MGLRNFQTQKEKLVVFRSVGHLCGPGGPKGMVICFLIQQMSSNSYPVELRNKKMTAHSDLDHNSLVMDIHLELVHSFLF